MDVAGSSNSTNEPSPGDIAQASVVIILGILVFFCSFLTIIVVHKFRSVSNPDILILALAIIDFISSFTVFPLAAFWYLRTGAYPKELCIVYGALTTAIQLASTAVVSVMTVDRFLAIRKPILYRTRLGSHQLKRIVVIMVVISAIIGSIPVAALITTNWTSMTNRHGYCTFRYSSNFTFVTLAISLPQIPLIVYCYYGFLVSIQKFIKRRHSHQVPSPASSNVSSEGSTSGTRLDTWISNCRMYCCCCCTVCRAKQTEATSKVEMVEKTQTMVKNMNLKKCTRMSKTVALIVSIYYVPWLLTLITMMMELFTKVDDNNSTLNLVTVRLMMAHSIFYPVVYATLCGNYRQAYKWALSLPFHSCGVEWHKRPPLGLTVSEMHRISHQMAADEWESPGLNRRLYSKRPYLKRSTTDSIKDNANVESDAGQGNPGFDRSEIASSDQNAEDGQITVEIIQENTSRRASVDNLAPSVSVEQIVPTDSPQLPQGPRMREEDKQGTSAPARRPLENQTSDSGVDVDSIQLDSAPSGSNSPAVYRLQTVESESSTSASDATEHLARVGDAREIETSFILDTDQQDKNKSTLEIPDINEIEANGVREQSETKDQIVINNEVRLHKFNDEIDIETDYFRTEHDDKTEETDKSPNIIAKNDDATVENDDVITEHDDVKLHNVADKSTTTESYSTGYSITETSPGKNSILRIEPCSSGGQCQGLVRIHVQVVEFRPHSPPLSSDTCSIQSKTRHCYVKSDNQKPSLKFNMQKNRFVPCNSSFEEMDSYSLELDAQSLDNASKAMTTPELNLPDADDTLQNGGTSNAETDDTIAIHGDIDESKLTNEPPAKGFKNRRMRASRALRESARYSDDIVHFSEMIMRRQNEDKRSGVKEELKETEASGSLPVSSGSKVIVTDQIDL